MIDKVYSWWLVAKLLRKPPDAHGPAAAFRPPPKSHREALKRFYERVAPDNLKNVDTILARFQSKPEAMYAILKKMYPGEVCERPEE